MQKRLICLIFCLFSLPLFGLSAYAATPLAEASDSHSTLRVYSERNGLKVQSTQWLAVEIEPREGWHSYWRNPGDSGAAPILDWQLPEGVTAAKPLFSLPELIPVGPLANYGYHGSSVLLVELETDANFTAKPLILEAEWLICEVECVPQFATLTVDGQSGDGSKVIENIELFSKTRAKLPEPSYWSARLEVGQDASMLTVFMAAGDVEGVENAH